MNAGLGKIAIVVDDDIDVFDEEQVLWAVSNRFQADRDLVVKHIELHPDTLRRRRRLALHVELGADVTHQPVA